MHYGGNNVGITEAPPVSRIRALKSREMGGPWRPLLLSAALLCGHCNAARVDESTATASLPIVGGTAVAPDKYPAVGALVAEADGKLGNPICTGVLLDSIHVLTAAHCVALRPNAHLSFLGVAHSQGDAASQAVEIASIDVHPDFALFRDASQSSLHDIALLTLAAPVADAIPAPLSSQAAPAVGEELTAVGFGPITGPTGPAGIENDAILQVQTISPGEFTVAPQPSPQPCFGDSGGPALSRTDSSQLVGIASRAAVDEDTNCSLGAVYTRVDVHVEWIVEQMRSTAHTHTDGGCAIARVAHTRRCTKEWMATALVLTLAWCLRRRAFRSVTR